LSDRLSFTVPGHPVGYKRTTQAGCKFDAGYKRYQAYKAEVVVAFLDQCPGDWGHPKPLTTTRASRTRVSVMAYFKNGVHPDIDNVQKAVQDALFVCDKYCSGNFDFDYDPVNPRVEVTLT
jgi:Holliday junction resolvase RusA-like endonuclease